MGEVVRLIKVNGGAEAKAWEAYKALCHAQARAPELNDNPAWQRLRDEAYRRWEALFEVA